MISNGTQLVFFPVSGRRHLGGFKHAVRLYFFGSSFPVEQGFEIMKLLGVNIRQGTTLNYMEINHFIENCERVLDPVFKHRLPDEQFDLIRVLKRKSIKSLEFCSTYMLMRTLSKNES